MKTAILLAAGASTRTTVPKQLFRVGNKPLVRHQADELLKSGSDRVIVVIGYYADSVGSALGRDPQIIVIRNPNPEEGMFSSLLAGIESAPGEGRILIHPVDVPLPNPTALWQLWEASSPITVAVCRGKKGHPVCLDAALAKTLLHSEHGRLDRWLEHHRKMTEEMETEDGRIVLNANTDAELERYFRSEER